MIALKDFLAQLAEALNAEPSQLTVQTPLDSLEGWDSMGQVSVVSLLDQIGVKSPPGALQKCRTAGDIVALGGTQISS